MIICVLQNFSLFQLDPTNDFKRMLRFINPAGLNQLNNNILTSTEHDREILPTILLDDDGSKRSNTSKSVSESCNTILYKHEINLKKKRKERKKYKYFNWQISYPKSHKSSNLNQTLIKELRSTYKQLNIQ